MIVTSLNALSCVSLAVSLTVERLAVPLPPTSVNAVSPVMGMPSTDPSGVNVVPSR